MAEPDSVAGVASTTASGTQEQSEIEAPASNTESNAPNDAEEDKDNDAASIKTTTTDIFSKSETSSSKGSESKQHKLGLDINYPWGWSGSNYDDYDVVTVHGVRDDYKNAWTDKEGAWWVKEQLFKKLSIREIDYSYEIEEGSTIYEPNGLRLHAERLVGEYAKARGRLEETETDRPVIWICHDLGGTIVKEALCIAMNDPSKYGKIAILTSAIIFLGTPHRSQSLDQLEGQLLKLMLLPGSDIKRNILSKVKNLARQVNSANQRFLATKILDRAVIFNIFVQSKRDSWEQNPVDDDVASIMVPRNKDYPSDPVTPFPRYAHHIGNSFDATGRLRLNEMDHLDLIRGDPKDHWFSDVSKIFNVDGIILRVGYNIIQFQARLLSLAPPTRALNTHFDPVLPKSPIVTWIYKQAACIAFSKRGKGPRLMHLYGNGNYSVDISELSRLLYVYYDSNVTYSDINPRKPHKTVLYFEFNQWDSRYSTVSALLTYLINALAWHFWTRCSSIIDVELSFLNDTCSWSLEDLYHLYATLRDFTSVTQELTFFISCFDQCPKDQRQWLLEHILEEQSYSDSEYRLILSTSTLEGLAVESFPGEARINLADCPTIGERSIRLTKELQTGLADLIAHRQIYEDFRPHLESLLEECLNAQHLGRIILTWLGNYPRGKPKSEITNIINKLSPATPENIVQVFVSFLAPELRPRAKNVFNWVKHALEPWSPESLIGALVVHECRDEEPLLDDLDGEGMMSDIEMAFGGVIITENRDVKFSHPSFYNLPELGIEGNTEERVSRINGTIAETCLRYFQLKGAQNMLKEFCLENFEGGPWATPLDTTVISHRRINMAEYAVRFWPQHYKASGRFKPSKLVHGLFASKESRAAWEVPFWLLTNTFTRIQRSYISTLPILAMLGLEDLVEEKVNSERTLPSFDKNCRYAITEAVRAGNQNIVQQLLGLATVDEEELQIALYWAAANSNTAIVDVLVEKIPSIETFQWSENIMFRAAAAGLDSLLATMLKSGCNINSVSNYWDAPLGVIVVWRDRLSTLELLLNTKPALDLTAKDSDGDDALICAAKKGNTRMIELLLKHDASIEVKNTDGQDILQVAIRLCKHKAIGILIKAGADPKSGETYDGVDFYLRPPLVVAADLGLRECVRVLLSNGADPSAECATGSALYKAVAGNHEDVVRLLLEHEPTLDMDSTPSEQDMLFVRAVRTGNIELVSLLIKYDAKIDFADPNGGFCKTPLSWACFEGDLNMVKLLLENKADINYTGGNSDAPLFTSLYYNEDQVASHLLQCESVDVMWTANDGWGVLHAAFNLPDMIPKILQKGAPIDGYCPYGTALHMASRFGYQKSIEALFENDPKPDIEYAYNDDASFQDEIGCTPLQLACVRSQPECVKVLLKLGANPKFRNKNGDDAVDILLRTETDSKDAQECLKLLLSRRYSILVDGSNDQGQTRLHSIREKTPISIVQLMVEAGAPLDARDQDGYTPLAIAISKGNNSVARYLIEQGVSVNVFGPKFGSILHLAITKGALDIIKLLVDSGADLETVDPEYGESLLYTALGIDKTKSELEKIVRYLVDEAKVPIDKLGGELAYPIIRATDITRPNFRPDNKILKFLIRRKAQLNVADKQGRRAVHLACIMPSDDWIKALVDAGAEIDVADKLGRKPIHFAAANRDSGCIDFLLDTDRSEDTDIIDAVDYDNWTPLLWAARTGRHDSITSLLERGADVWVRGRVNGTKEEWSALKLSNFSNQNQYLPARSLVPEERVRINQDNEREEWDDKFHRIKPGGWKDAKCKSCFTTILGIEWKCTECADDFSLCFKCYGRHTDIHDPEHSFEGIEPMYDDNESSKPTSTSSDKASPEETQEASGSEEEENAQDTINNPDEPSSPAETYDETELDLASFVSDGED
ncbi:putative ankyrin repeat protein [Jackrogersella minutella]|nr:putative ankyrin repeat protein [Jackrogersella minutella]